MPRPPKPACAEPLRHRQDRAGLWVEAEEGVDVTQASTWREVGSSIADTSNEKRTQLLAVVVAIDELSAFRDSAARSGRESGVSLQPLRFSTTAVSVEPRPPTPGGTLRQNSCHCRTLYYGTVNERMMIGKRGKVILYLSCLLIVARVAANRGEDPGVNVPRYVDDPKLQARLLSFKQGGVGREVNTDNYDIDGVIEYAESLIGTPHVMGGYSPSGLDCSGLVKLAHAQFGVDLPRSSHEQGRYGTIIPPGEELKRGDLVFFHSTYRTPNLITHSGIYVGENKFIHTSTSRGVSVSVLLDSAYWQKHYLFATRLKD